MKNLEEKQISSELLLKARIIDVKRDTIVASNGKESYREVVVHPGGVVILPVDKDGNFILIKQWRYCVNQELIEAPAGKLEFGEEPFPCAQRELREETGYIAKNWKDLGFIYTTPGFCTEKLYLYKAEYLEFKGTDFDETEVIEPFVVSPQKAMELIKSGEIKDSKTICAIAKVLK